MKTAIVILNYNGRKMLEQFLPSLIDAVSPESAQIIITDNASTDDSISYLNLYYPKLQRIVLDKNYGFAEGYNRAIAQVDAEYILLLNSDVEVTKDFLSPLVAELDNNPDIVAVQPKVLAFYDKRKFEHAGAAGGFIDALGYPFCRGRIMDITEEDNGQYDEDIDILWTTGAAMLVRREEYLKAGGLDASFFAHQEEIDLCWRLASRSWKLRCITSSVVYHLGGGTLNMGSPRKTYLNFRNNLCLIYKNHPNASKILFIRYFLDYLAAFMFLLKGETGNFKAVFKARRDYAKMKKELKTKRKENLKFSQKLPFGICSFSLLFNFYFKGKKKFSDFRKMMG